MILRRLLALTLSLVLVLPAPLAAQSRSLLEYPSVHSPTIGTKGMIVSQNSIAKKRQCCAAAKHATRQRRKADAKKPAAVQTQQQAT